MNIAHLFLTGSVSISGHAVKTDPYLTRDIPPPKTEDGLYCASVLGEALTIALAEIVDKRPWDPIEFLGHWLQKYAANTARVKRVSFMCLVSFKPHVKYFLNFWNCHLLLRQM
jgi:hypothetical protein